MKNNAAFYSILVKFLQFPELINTRLETPWLSPLPAPNPPRKILDPPLPLSCWHYTCTSPIALYIHGHVHVLVPSTFRYTSMVH